MTEEEQENNFTSSVNSVNNVDVRLENDCEPENDNVVGVEPDLIVVESGRGHGIRGRSSRGRGCARGVKQKGGNDSRGVVEGGSTSTKSSGGRLTSDVWNHFKKFKDVDGVNRAVCNYCSKVLTGHYSSGTTHLKNHFTSCLRRNFKNVGQMLLAKKHDGSVTVESCSEVKCDMATVKITIARMIILHELPLSFVEYEGFRDLMKLVQPTFDTISRNTIKNEILKLYDVERSKTMNLLDACESRIAITTDMWTASNQKKGYMVITAHYIDNLWVLRSRIIK